MGNELFGFSTRSTSFSLQGLHGAIAGCATETLVVTRNYSDRPRPRGLFFMSPVWPFRTHLDANCNKCRFV